MVRYKDSKVWEDLKGKRISHDGGLVEDSRFRALPLRPPHLASLFNAL